MNEAPEESNAHCRACGQAVGILWNDL